LSARNEEHLEEVNDNDERTGATNETKETSSVMPKKRSALTTTSPIATQTAKRIKLNSTEETNTYLPEFLSRTDDKFKLTLNPLLKQEASSIDIEQLRQIALLKYQIALLKYQIAQNNLEISLWDTYLRSGTGTIELPYEQRHRRQQTTAATTTTMANLSMSPVSLSLWPDHLKTKIIESSHQKNTKIPKLTDLNQVTDSMCHGYVHEKLSQYFDEIEVYLKKLEEQKSQLINGLPREIEEAIDQFIEEHALTFEQIPIDGLIASAKYHYVDRSFELEFLQENPRDYHLELFEKLSRGRYLNDTAKLNVTILKERLVHNHLPSTFTSIEIPLPIPLTAIENNEIRQRLSERYDKILQETKSKMMLMYIAVQEAQAEGYQQIYDRDHAESENLTSTESYKRLTPTLQLSFQSFKLHVSIKNEFFRQNSDGQTLDCIRRSDHSKMYHTGGCTPILYQNTLHRLSEQKQVMFLNRGPAYVSPCQLHTLSYSTNTRNSLQQILQKQMAPLRRQITKLFREYPIAISRETLFDDTIQTLFTNSFSTAVPPKLKQRAEEEKQLIQSIRHYLKQNRLILRRTADDCNTYYIGSLEDFHSKSQQYIENSTNYEIHGGIHEDNDEQKQLDDILQSIDFSLNNLKERKLITEEQVLKLSLRHRKDIQLPALYFLPNMEHDRITLSGKFVQLIYRYVVE
jgi:hypothetical protein